MLIFAFENRYNRRNNVIKTTSYWGSSYLLERLGMQNTVFYSFNTYWKSWKAIPLPFSTTFSCIHVAETGPLKGFPLGMKLTKITLRSRNNLFVITGETCYKKEIINQEQEMKKVTQRILVFVSLHSFFRLLLWVMTYFQHKNNWSPPRAKQLKEGKDLSVRVKNTGQTVALCKTTHVTPCYY